MGSRKWKVVYTSDVKRFLSNLSSSETKLFKECLKQIAINPHEDGIHKFSMSTRMPLVEILYRDDDFVLVYYCTQVIKPTIYLKITVFQAARTRDHDEGNSTPRRR